MTDITLPSSSGHFLATSEAMASGHPDKVADQIAEAIVDACLDKDPESKLSCDVLLKTGMIMLFGTALTNSRIDFDSVVRTTVKQIGYDSLDKGLDYKNMMVFNRLDTQASEPELDLAQERRCRLDDATSCNDAVSFGYATNETPQLIPLSHQLANNLCYTFEKKRHGLGGWARPDGKAQVTLEYAVANDGSLKPLRVHTVVMSVQHSPEVTIDRLRNTIIKQVIRPTIPANLMDSDTIVHVNPSGRFVIGGPRGDAGMSGHQVVADCSGGWCPHGNSVPIGRDGLNVQRCGTYAARWVAKSLVHAGLAARCCVQIAYAGGVSAPLSLSVDSFGSAKSGLSDEDLCNIVNRNFDLRPTVLARDLELCKPQFLALATFGHFGRVDCMPKWEKCKGLRVESAKANKWQ